MHSKLVMFAILCMALGATRLQGKEMGSVLHGQVAEAAAGEHLFRVGRTGINCYREPCPRLGIMPARPDGRPSAGRPAYSGPTPPAMKGSASDLARIERAWSERGCMLVEGRLVQSPASFEVFRVLGEC
jgi:hypothetical protein